MGARPYATAKAAVTVRLVDGPTALIGMGGLRQLTDPALGALGPSPAAPARWHRAAVSPSAPADRS
ncbi:hypothetical protein [Streptomyces sp. NPDC059743]|uniref:hypothetical protein n=1 Tax=Streptomyces sp. NPDC059743 TaxID=3346928 RepID=UPI00366A2782